MKRVFAVLLAAMMILCIVPVNSVIALGTPTFSVSEARSSAGEQVTLSVNIASNPGVIAVGLQIGYDSAVLELKSAAIKDFADTSFGPTTGNPFNISWDDVLNPNNTTNGTLAELTFQIKEGTALGEYPVTVSYDEDNVFNSNFNNVYFATQNGKITVVEKSVAVTGVTIDETISVNIGEKKTPTYTVQPGNASNKAVSFVSSDPSIASVNETTGEITGVAKGTAMVTVTTVDGGFSDTCAVTVACPHTSKTQVAEKASTCTEQGWDAYSKCNTCDQLFDSKGGEITAIPYRALLAHTKGTPIRENDIAATCETAGSYDEVVYCTVCHKEITREQKVNPKLGHDLIHHDAKAPTCTEIGWDAYDTCSRCDYTTYSEIVALGHDWDDGTITTEATCTTDGVKTYTCKNNAEHTYTEVVPKLGHTPSDPVIENEIAATCVETGSYESVVYCSVCHEEISRETFVTAIDENAHMWSEWIQTKAPTENEKGEETRYCLNDSTHKETRDIPELAHTHRLSLIPAKEATCTESGNTAYYVCSGCGRLFEDDDGNIETSFEIVTIAALGHDLVHHGAKATTCTEIGWKAYDTCSRCDYTTYSEIEALGHDLIHHDAKDPTCMEIGWNAYDTCSRCDYTTYSEIEALGHNLIHHDAKDPTCTEIGWDAYDTCSRCDYTTYVEKAELGHDLIHHDAKAPTCTEIGWEAYDTCARCDYTTYVEKPALGHDLIHHDAKAPTCTEIGWEAYDTCSRCDYTTYVEKPALGHDLIHHDAKAPTCTEIGWDAYDTCSRCDYTTYIEKAALGHEYKAVVSPPKCTEKGFTTYTCSRCGDSYITDYTDATGHKYDGPEWTWNEHDAEAKFTCSTCDDVVTVDATVAKTEDKGIITYTATAVFNDKSYTDSKTEYIEYTVKFVDYDGTVISEKTYHYGEEVDVPKDPIREEDNKYTYTFKGWDKDIAKVTDNATYTATYNKTEKPLFIPGDINGDGQTNNKDIVALFRYVSGGNVDIKEIALDVNGDGSVNNKDVTILFRYVSGSPVTISDKPYTPKMSVVMIAFIPSKSKSDLIV